MRASIPSAPYRSAACGLGEAHRGDLGVAVGDSGDARFVDDGRVESGDVLGDEDALLEAAVGQLETRHDVAGGADPGHVGAEALVGEDEAAVHRDADLLVAELRRGRAASDRHQQQVGLVRLAGLDGHTDALLCAFGGLDRRVGLRGDAAAAERTLDHLGGRLVLEGDQAWQGLDDRDLGTERAPHAGELDADHATAEDDHGSGYVVEQERVLAA